MARFYGNVLRPLLPLRTSAKKVPREPPRSEHIAWEYLVVHPKYQLSVLFVKYTSCEGKNRGRWPHDMAMACLWTCQEISPGVAPIYFIRCGVSSLGSRSPRTNSNSKLRDTAVRVSLRPCSQSCRYQRMMQPIIAVPNNKSTFCA